MEAASRRRWLQGPFRFTSSNGRDEPDITPSLAAEIKKIVEDLDNDIIMDKDLNGDGPSRVRLLSIA